MPNYFSQNRLQFNDLVRGRYGRKVAYVDYDEVTPDNILKILSESIGCFNYNKPVVRYLWNYKNGDQPILYREKLVRDDIVNKIVENHAMESVLFKVSQSYGEPIQYVSTSKDEKTNKAIDKLNDFMRMAYKYQRNIQQGEWQSAVGTSFLAVQMTHETEMPYRIAVPTPMNTFVIYSSYTGEPLLAVQELKDAEGKQYYLCFSKIMQFVVKNGKLERYGLHAYSDIPITEVPNNQNRISDTELVITLYDAINNMQSNRMDGVEQFIQSWVKFVNCEIDEEEFQKMKQEGALVVKSNNGSDNKADVDVMTTELNQTETQVAKDDLLDNALAILGIPNRESQNSGGDTQGAVSLRAGWDHARGRARIKDSYIVEAEMRLLKVVLNVLRLSGNDLGISLKDVTVNILHSPTDNLYTKAQALQTMLTSGVSPLVAMTTCGLWGDSEKVYLQSKPFLNAKYAVADENIKATEQTQDTVFKNQTGKEIEEL